MMDEIDQLTDKSNDMVNVAKGIQIYSAVVNIITAWSYIQESTIVKCFRQCGIPHLSIRDLMTSPADIVKEVVNDTQHPLADVPWEEFEEFQSNLQAEAPVRAPDGDTYARDGGDGDSEGELLIPDISHNEAILTLKCIPKLCLGNQKL